MYAAYVVLDTNNNTSSEILHSIPIPPHQSHLHSQRNALPPKNQESQGPRVLGPQSWTSSYPKLSRRAKTHVSNKTSADRALIREERSAIVMAARFAYSNDTPST
jgi:hypothetical protein